MIDLFIAFTDFIGHDEIFFRIGIENISDHFLNHGGHPLDGLLGGIQQLTDQPELSFVWQCSWHSRQYAQDWQQSSRR